MSKVRFIRAPRDLSPQLRGFYERVARRLGVDPLYVNQVARGEGHSALVEDALENELTKILERGARDPYRHEVQFYSDDAVLLDRVVPFVAAALKRGDPAIILATKSHRDSLFQRLKADGVDIDAAVKAGMYVAVDAVSTLSTFLRDDMPESGLVFKAGSSFIEEAAKTAKTVHPRVAVFGECVSLLWEEGRADAAIRLERLWNQIALSYEVDILCGYKLSGTSGEDEGRDFKRICVEHNRVFLT